MPSAGRGGADVAAHLPDARPWAKAIKAAVLTQKMPPWQVGRERPQVLERRGSQAERTSDRMGRWRRREGDAKDKPAALTFPDGWNLKPDLIVEMPNEFACRRRARSNISTCW